MLPQLATSTFSSQIFWVIVGFFCVYGIVTFVAVPRLRKILRGRQAHIDTLLEVAKKFGAKSDSVRREAEEVLARTRQDTLSSEERLVGELEQKNAEEKQRLSKEILESADRSISLLKVSSEEAFEIISSDLDELLDLALQKIGNQKS